jgi:hypothetical protein
VLFFSTNATLLTPIRTISPAANMVQIGRAELAVEFCTGFNYRGYMSIGWYTIVPITILRIVGDTGILAGRLG